MNTKLNTIKKLIKEERYDEALHKVIILERMVGDSPDILSLKGDLIQLTNYDGAFDLQDAADCYKKIIEQCPYNFEAYIELYKFYKNVINDEEKAHNIRLKAIDVISDIHLFFSEN